jgi:hypothetical protein
MTSLAQNPSHFASITSAETFRTAIAASPDANCVPGVLAACLRPIVYSRHHWLVYKGEYRVRADLRGALESIQQRPPHEWDAEETDLVYALFALDAASVGLDELDDRVDSEAVRAVLLSRHALYAGVAEPGAAPPEGLLELAAAVERMRPQVQRSHLLYSIIDGKAWFRGEGVMPHGAVDAAVLTDEVAGLLDTVFDAPPGPAEQRLRAATRTAVDADGDSASVVRAVLQAALADPVLRADHVTLTCPMGDLLDRPHEMTTSAAFFTETYVRDGLDLAGVADRLGHESVDQLQRTIKARMLKLKRGAIRGLYGPGCMQGRFVEKHGGHMIFRNEDAHYRGHQSIGCSSGGRASFALRYERDATAHEMTPMVGDFRVVRMSHDELDIFSADELRQVIRYGEWIRVVVEETYRLGAVVRDDTPAVASTPS